MLREGGGAEVNQRGDTQVTHQLVNQNEKRLHRTRLCIFFIYLTKCITNCSNSNGILYRKEGRRGKGETEGYGDGCVCVRGLVGVIKSVLCGCVFEVEFRFYNNRHPPSEEEFILL